MQVSFGNGLRPDHPSSPILSDPQCVAAWLQSSLAAARYDLSTALSQGLPSIASSQIAPRHVAKLQILVMVAETLASKSFSTTGPAGSSARIARRILTTQSNTPAAFVMGATTSSLPETPSSLVIEATRLLQTAKVMHWLSTQKLLQTSPSGRFSSHSTWQGTVSLRKSGAGSFPLLLTELIDAMMQYDVDVISYPPPSPESFITTLFLSGNSTTEAAFQSKLALFSYCMVDANFLKAPDLVKGVHRHFGISRATACGWMLLLFLDDAQLVALDAPTNSSLSQAVNWLPGVNGLTIPFRALRVFVDRGRGDVALGLLRQRMQDEKKEKKEQGGDVTVASTALRVRLANGLLVESFIEMKRYLQSIPDEGVRGQHAQRLIEELLTWGSTTEGALNGVISLSISPAHEEPALISWLQRSTHSMPSAGIILTLYLLMRGRTPEALLAYSLYGKQAAAAAGAEEICGHVEELLRAACRTMPAAQRALVVGTAAEPALLFSAEDQAMVAADGGDGVGGFGNAGGGTALVSALPGLDTGGLPMLISVGPTSAEAPLVGGVMTSLARAAGLAQGRREKIDDGAAPLKSSIMKSGKAVLPLLFGQTPAPTTTLRSSTPFGLTVDVQGAGSGAFNTTASASGLGTGRRQQHHQLDALLGITPRTQATGTKGRRTLR